MEHEQLLAKLLQLATFYENNRKNNTLRPVEDCCICGALACHVKRHIQNLRK